MANKKICTQDAVNLIAEPVVLVGWPQSVELRGGPILGAAVVGVACFVGAAHGIVLLLKNRVAAL